MNELVQFVTTKKHSRRYWSFVHQFMRFLNSKPDRQMWWCQKRRIKRCLADMKMPVKWTHCEPIISSDESSVVERASAA